MLEQLFLTPKVVIWNDNQQIIGPLESGEEEILEWQWESNNPGEFTIIVETTKKTKSSK